MDAIKLSPFCIFVVYGYLQHSDVEYLKNHNLRYYVYFVSDALPLNNFIDFAYEWIIEIAGPAEKITPTNQIQ